MKLNTTRVIVLLLGLVVSSSGTSVQAKKKQPTSASSCQTALSPKTTSSVQTGSKKSKNTLKNIKGLERHRFEFIFSHLSPKQKADLVDDFKDSLRVAKLLGYRVPDQQFVMMSSEEMLQFLAAMGPAMPHWLDGMRLMGRASMMSALEFVERGHQKGCDFCRSFYDESTPRNEQQSIADHVMGHNHVSSTSRIAIRQGDLIDRIQTKRMRVRSLEKAYENYDLDEVSMYVQLLHSLSHAVDLTTGTLERVDDLKPRPAAKPEVFDGWRNALGQPIEKKQTYSKVKNPPRATPSLIQAIVANLQDHLQDWQHTLAHEEEQMSRVVPNFLQTQILNEGWATFSQALIARHREGNTSGKLIDVAHLITGARGHTAGEKVFNKKLSWLGPTVGELYLGRVYWLGYEGWKNLWHRFYKRPEVQAMGTILEKDQAFVQYATRIIESYNDSQFLYLALDDNWILKHRLNLSRPQRWYERGSDNWVDERLSGLPYLVLSTNPERIRHQIVRRFTNKKLKHPQIVLKNLNHRNEEALYEQKLFKAWPVELRSAAQMLYLLTHFHEKTSSLKTALSPLTLVMAGVFKLLGSMRKFYGVPLPEEPPIGLPDDDWGLFTFSTVDAPHSFQSHFQNMLTIDEKHLGAGDLYAVSPSLLHQANKKPAVQKFINELKQTHRNKTPYSMLQMHARIQQILQASIYPPPRPTVLPDGRVITADGTWGMGSTPPSSPAAPETTISLLEEAINAIGASIYKDVDDYLQQHRGAFGIVIRVSPAGQVEVQNLATEVDRNELKKAINDLKTQWQQLLPIDEMVYLHSSTSGSEKIPKKKSARQIAVEYVVQKLVHFYIQKRLLPRLQKAVDHYKADLWLNMNADQVQLNQSMYAAPLAQLTQVWLRDTEAMLSHTPLAGEAVQKFVDLLKRRVQRSLEELFQNIFQGKPSRGGRATSRGIALKALPILPSFQLDKRIEKYRQHMAYANETSLGYMAPWGGAFRRTRVTWAEPGPVDDALENLVRPELDDYVDIGQGDLVAGEIFYRDEGGDGENSVGPPGGGKGEGDDEGDDDGDGDGAEDGDDEGAPSPGGQPGSGGDGLQTGEVLISYDVWGKFLHQHFELPNTRKTRAGETRVELRYAGQYYRDDEPLLIEPTANEAFEEGFAQWVLNNPDKDIENLSPEDERELFERGLSHLDPNRVVTRAYQPKPIPDFKAVLVIDEDMSGSMYNEPKKAAKNFAYNLISLLRATYAHVELVFVGHSHFAKEFTEEEFWKGTIDGGTEDSTGFKLSHEIMTTRFPKSEYNRYFLSIGDAGNSTTDNAVAVEWLEKIYKEVQHGVYVTVSGPRMWGPSQLSNEAYDKFADSHEWFDTVNIGYDFSSMMKAFKELYGKKK